MLMEGKDNQDVEVLISVSKCMFHYILSNLTLCFLLVLTACCNHCRAVDLFAESINTEKGFVGVRCESFEAFQNGSCDGNEKELMGDKVSSR